LWGTNPLALLNCDDDEWLILVACAKVVEKDREDQQREAERNRP
jgi:hypothetical protein